LNLHQPRVENEDNQISQIAQRDLSARSKLQMLKSPTFARSLATGCAIAPQPFDRESMQPSPDIEAFKLAYAGLNANDFSRFAEILDPDAEWIEFLGSPNAGTYRGRDAILAHFTTARGRWAEGSCEPQRLIVAGERVIQVVQVHVKLKGETQWHEGEVTEVYTFRSGKIVHARLFGDFEEAMNWAGTCLRARQ
jgi:ketosteroid isomerase-like protein